MHREDSHNDLGAIRIHDNVIASIAAVAASEIEGVKGIEKNLKTSILELIDKKAANLSSIKVEKDKNGDISISIPLIIKYGYNVPEVAARAQENIKAALERMINISLKDININVRAIERG